ncbi:MAG: TRAP transporter small permease subunit [Pseudomonadota bacterium]
MLDFAPPLAVITVLLIPLAFAFFGAGEAAAPVLKRIVKAAFAVSSACGLLLLLTQLGIVILSSVFSVSFIWLQEGTLYLFGAMFLLSSGALILSEGHVRVDILYTNLNEARQRQVDLVGMLIFVIPVSILIIIVSWDYVATSWIQLERSQEPSGIHAVFLLKSMIPGFAVLLMLAAEVRVIEILGQMRGRS